MRRSRISTLMDVALAALWIAALCFLLLEIHWLEKTIHGMRLLAISLLVGALAGLIVGGAWGWKNHHLLSGMVSPLRRTLIFAGGMALLLGMLSAATSSLINRKFSAEKSIHAVSFVVTDKHLGGKSGKRPMVWVEVADHHVEWFEVDKKYYDKVIIGQRASLIISPGALGFDVIQSWVWIS